MFTVEDRGEAPVQHDIDGIFAVRAGGQDFDTVDQRAERVDDLAIDRLRGGGGLVEQVAQAGDLFSPAARGVRVQLDDAGATWAGLGLVQGDELGLELGLFRLQLLQSGRRGRRIGPVADLVDQALDRARGLRQALLQWRAPVDGLGLAPAHRLAIGAHVLGHRLRREEPRFQPLDHALVERLAADGPPVRAGRITLLAVGSAGELAAAIAGVARAAAALVEPAEQGGHADQMLGPAVLRRGLARAGGGPQFLRHEAEVWDRRALPRLRGQGHGDAAARVPVLLHVDATPDLHAGVELGVEDPVAALARSVDGRGVPQAAASALHALAVEGRGDRPRRLAVGVGLEDPPHHLGFGLDDDHGTAGLGAVAVEARAGRAARRGVRLHAALGLLAQVLEVELAEQALQRDLLDPDRVVVQGGDRHAEVGEAVEDRGLVLEVARDPVLVFGQQDVIGSALRRLQRCVQPGPIGHGRPADRRVAEG